MPWSGVLPASDETAGPDAAQIARHRRRIVVTALWVFGRNGWRGTPEQMKRSGLPLMAPVLDRRVDTAQTPVRPARPAAADARESFPLESHPDDTGSQ